MDKHNDFIEQLIAEEKAQTSYDSPLIDETIDGDPDSFESKKDGSYLVLSSPSGMDTKVYLGFGDELVLLSEASEIAWEIDYEKAQGEDGRIGGYIELTVFDKSPMSQIMEAIDERRKNAAEHDFSLVIEYSLECSPKFKEELRGVNFLREQRKIGKDDLVLISTVIFTGKYDVDISPI